MSCHSWQSPFPWLRTAGAWSKVHTDITKVLSCFFAGRTLPEQIEILQLALYLSSSLKKTSRGDQELWKTFRKLLTNKEGEEARQLGFFKMVAALFRQPFRYWTQILPERGSFPAWFRLTTQTKNLLASSIHCLRNSFGLGFKREWRPESLSDSIHLQYLLQEVCIIIHTFSNISLDRPQIWCGIKLLSVSQWSSIAFTSLSWHSFFFKNTFCIQENRRILMNLCWEGSIETNCTFQSVAS